MENKPVDSNKKDYSAYHYRTSSRFGSRVKLTISGKDLTVNGPRISPLPYWIWIYTQSALLLLVIPAIVVPIALGRPIFILLVLAVLLIHNSVGAIGATALWEYSVAMDFSGDTNNSITEIPLKDIRDIRVGKGWERKGLWFVIPYVIPLINTISKDVCISFEAYDNITKKDVVYALLFRNSKEAKEFLQIVSIAK